MKISAFILLFVSCLWVTGAYAGGCDEDMPCDPMPQGQAASIIVPPLISTVYLTTTTEVEVAVTSIMTVSTKPVRDDVIKKGAILALIETALIDLIVARPSLITSLLSFLALLGLSKTKPPSQGRAIIKQIFITVIIFIALFMINCWAIDPTWFGF